MAGDTETRMPMSASSRALLRVTSSTRVTSLTWHARLTAVHKDGMVDLKDAGGQHVGDLLGVKFDAVAILIRGRPSHQFPATSVDSRLVTYPIHVCGSTPT